MKLLALDGNSILNRAFYGIKILTTKDGHFTNAIYGFMTTLEKLKDEVKPDAIAIAFDLREPTFRHKAFEKYKAQRKGMPEELAQQLPVLKELLVNLGYKLIMSPGYEADDILGTLAHACDLNGYECVIATGDRDSLQLVSKNVTVRIASTKLGKADIKIFDENQIMETYGVLPQQLIDIKALQGDTSDNIPGVKGIGEKTAKDLIQKYKSIEYIYNNIEAIDIKESVKKKLINDKENAFMSKMLGTIVKNVPIDTKVENYVVKKIDIENTYNIMSKLELFSLMKKLGIENNVKEDLDNRKIINIKLSKSIDKILDLNNCTFIIDNNESKCFMIILSEDNVYITMQQKDEFENTIKKFLEKDSISKNVYNLKKLYTEINCEFVGNKVFDVMLAEYVLNPSLTDYSLERIMNKYDVTDPTLSGDEVDDYLKDLVIKVYKLSEIAKLQKLELSENNQELLLNDIEVPLSKVLSSMESIGFKIDKNGLNGYGNELGLKLEVLKKEIYKIVGYEFNINSPKQLGEVLFEKLCLPKGKKGKNGYSTNAEILEELRNYHPVVSMILDYRALHKLKSTYCDGMIKLISEDERIHSNFNQTETRTGRISSTEPNLQNIPIRTESGKVLRKYFCAEDGFLLIDADYSQIELRVLAHLSGDKNMIDAFINNEDIHAITASQIFNVPIEMVNPSMRTKAKAVNFGIVYGIGAFSLSKDLGIMVKDADRYIKAYLNHYSGVERYMKEVTEKAKNLGYSETMLHRRRYLPELNSSNFNIRSFGERVARNMPIQGTAADIIKIAMIRVYKRLKEKNMKSRLILQVHDELILEAHESEVEEVEKILIEEMENAVKLEVPLLVHIDKGATWYDTKD